MAIFQDWLLTFYRIIVSPLPRTFINEAKKAKGKFPSAVLWLTLAVLIADAIIYFATGYFPVSRILMSLIFLPIIFLVFVFSLDILYKKLFDRKKSYYDELLYLVVGVYTPFSVISSLTSLIPKVGQILSWILFVYPLLLVILLLKSLTNLKFWQASVVVSLGTILTLGSLFCIPAFILSMMGALPRILF